MFYPPTHTTPSSTPPSSSSSSCSQSPPFSFTHPFLHLLDFETAFIMEIKPLQNSQPVFLVFFSTSLLSSCIYSQTPRSRRSTLFSFLPFPTISLHALSPLKSRLLWSLCLFPNQPLVHLHCCPPLNNLRVTVPWALRCWHLTYSFLLCCELFMIIACAFMWENKSSALNLAIPWPAHFQWPSAFISNSLMNSLPSTSSPLKSWNHLSHSDHNHFIVFLTSWTFLDLWTPTFSASALFLYHFV